MIRVVVSILCLLALPLAARAVEPPAWLPRYDLDIRIDPAQRLATVRQRVTVTNRHNRPMADLVFNAHARYTIPDDQVGFTAKMAEILRIAPKEALPFEGPALEVTRVSLIDAVQPATTNAKHRVLPHQYGEANLCSFSVPLVRPIVQGESATVEIEFTFKIPNKKGRWSQYNDIITLAQWLPTLAVYNEEGWHALPFIPWHQPFYNEAGVYSGRITLPAEQKLACPCPIREQRPTEGGLVEMILEPLVLRDFSLTCSAKYQVTEGDAGRVKVRCLHLPEHADYAKILVKTSCEAIPVYEGWFGPYPYPQFVIAEACFGWNGNECGGMVLIDDRMFNMPSIAKNYPIYLIQHELCHQWWYNVVGTNGYAETFMDEALAVYFSHRLADITLGKNNPIIQYPTGLGWLPNIHRDDLRNYGIVGAQARGDIHPTVQPIDKFEHLPNLLSYTYDRGSKIIGQIEQRLGDAAFLDFMRTIYRKYYFQILTVADFQRELELYTGRSWDDFFRYWIHGSGNCDWKIDRVEINGRSGPLARWASSRKKSQVVIDLFECKGFPEPTVLGLKLRDGEDFSLRIPIDPSVPELELPEQNVRVECRSTGNGKQTAVRVTLTTSCSPRQIVVDPDHVLLDSNPGNNAWKWEPRIRFTPLYTALDELDVTNPYDRCSFIFGPWISTAMSTDPWYQPTSIAGVRAGVYDTQNFKAGAFAAYRSNDHNIIAGADALWDHVPLPRSQIGVLFEQGLKTFDEPIMSRGVIFGRYIITYGSSLYMPAFEYVEAFATGQHHPLMSPHVRQPGADAFEDRTAVGLHYHKNLLTPYWDPEGGVALDVTYQYGIPIFGLHRDYHQCPGQTSTVKSRPEWIAERCEGPIMAWMMETRFAFRLGGGVASRQNGEFFALGGGDQFRGFDVRERLGSAYWLASAEWRIPVMQNIGLDLCDKIISVRNVYVAPFYDVGAVYHNGRTVGDTGQALGVGLRVDIQWLGIIERTMVRMDVAKSLTGDVPWQFWFGVQHPF